MHAYIDACIHAYIHTYIHTHMHTCTQAHAMHHLNTYTHVSQEERTCLFDACQKRNTEVVKYLVEQGGPHLLASRDRVCAGAACVYVDACSDVECRVFRAYFVFVV